MKVFYLKCGQIFGVKLTKYIYLKLLLIFVFFNLANTANATVRGCLIGGNRVYYGDEIYGSVVILDHDELFRDPAYYVGQVQCGGASNNSYYTIVSQSGTCYAHYKGSGAWEDKKNYLYKGNSVMFNVLACPIDDYIPIAVFGFGIFGYLMIKRRVF